MSFTSRRISGERGPLSSAAPAVIKTSKGLWGWYRAWKERKREEDEQALHARIFKRAALIVSAVLIILILLGGTVKALIALKILTPQSFLGATAAELVADKDGFTNVLLLGTGDKGHDGVDLTDTIMIASFDPRTKSVVLLSLPRDLYAVKTDKMGSGRINALYRDYKYYLRSHKDMGAEEASMEAMHELRRELGRQLGMEIQYAMKVDFIAFVQAVDALGGVDIDVPQDIVDTEYPGPNYTYETFSIEAGPQHLDGETALKYARSRHTTSDFDRSARQQQILKALADKAREEGVMSSPGKITSLFRIVADNVESTMSLREMLGGAKLAEGVDRANIISMNLSNEVGYGSVMPSPGGFLYNPPLEAYNGASVLLPMAVGNEAQGSWRQLRAFTYVLLHSRTMLLSRPQVYVLNAGAKTGLARTLAAELTRYGFDVSQVANLAETASDHSQDRETSSVSPAVEADAAMAEFFAGLLQLPTAPRPEGIAPEKLGQVTIVLGKDYEFTPMQELVPSEEMTNDAVTDDQRSSSSTASSTSSQ